MSRFSEFVKSLFGGEQKLEDAETEQKLADIAESYIDVSLLEQLINDAIAQASSDTQSDGYVPTPARFGLQAIMDLLTPEAPAEQEQAEEVPADEEKKPADEVKKPEEEEQVMEDETEEVKYITEDEVKSLISEVVAKTMEVMDASTQELKAQVQELSAELEKPSKKPEKVVPTGEDNKQGKFDMQEYIDSLGKK